MTHPTNLDRERHAKQNYIASQEDSREAWTLFRNVDSLRRKTTDQFYQESSNTVVRLQCRQLGKTFALALLEEEYTTPIRDPKYQGIYFSDRQFTIHAAAPNELFEDRIRNRNAILAQLTELYPKVLREVVTLHQRQQEKVAALKAIEKGILEAPEAPEYQGENRKSSQLFKATGIAEKELEALTEALQEHDRRCRSAHRNASFQIQQGWDDYYESLFRLLHYTEHMKAELADAAEHLHNELVFKTATGTLREDHRHRITTVANDLYGVMHGCNGHTKYLVVPEAILKRMELPAWGNAFPPINLPWATGANLHEWVPSYEDSLFPMMRALQRLRTETLNEILACDQLIEQMLRGEQAITPAPAPARTPETYPIFIAALKRKKQEQLDAWSRFLIGEGKLFGTLRFAVSGSVVAACAAAGFFVGACRLHMHNGLAIEVRVKLNQQEVIIPAGENRDISIGTMNRAALVTSTADGRPIETYHAILGDTFANYVYNVGGASCLIESDAVYGNQVARPDRIIGGKHLHETTARSIFTPPPRSISTKGNGGLRVVLDSTDDLPPHATVAMLLNSDERERMIGLHARFDDAEHPNTRFWLELCSESTNPENSLTKVAEFRLAYNPHEVLTWRCLLDQDKASQRSEAVAQVNRLAAENPEDADLQYLRIRAMPEGEQQDNAIQTAFTKWPDNRWLMHAKIGYNFEHGEWDEAESICEQLASIQGALQTTAQVHLARLTRYRHKSSHVETPGTDCGWLQYALFFEQDIAPTAPSALAIWHLHRGELEQAEHFLSQDANETTRILLAASSGAKPEWSEQVLAAPVSPNWSTNDRLYLAALAFRCGKPSLSYLEQDKGIEDSAKQKLAANLAFKEWLTTNPLIEANEFLEAKRKSMRPDSFGLLVTAFTIAQPDHISSEWKECARYLLFAHERPLIDSYALSPTEDKEKTFISQPPRSTKRRPRSFGRKE